MKKHKKKPDWLHGDQRENELALYREMATSHGRSLPDDQIEEIEDKLRLERMEVAALNPAAVLNHAEDCLCRVPIGSKNLKLLTSCLKSPTAETELLSIKKRMGQLGIKVPLGMLYQFSESLKNRVEIIKRSDPKLRSMGDAGHWLRKTRAALKDGMDFAERAQASPEGDERTASFTLAVEAFFRAVSFAYYLGLECHETKARAAMSRPGQKHREPEHPLYRPARLAFDALREKGIRDPKPSQIIERMDNSPKRGKQSARGKNELCARTVSTLVGKWAKRWKRESDH